MNRKNIFIICLIFILFMPPLVEAKTADEWINEGIESGQAGKYSDAIKAFDEALKINTQFAEAWNNKGIALIKLGRNDDAIEALDQALKINPQFAEAWNNKGFALYDLKRYDEAIKAYASCTVKIPIIGHTKYINKLTFNNSKYTWSSYDIARTSVNISSKKTGII